MPHIGMAELALAQEGRDGHDATRSQNQSVIMNPLVRQKQVEVGVQP
jgi:hypothetical protein